MANTEIEGLLRKTLGLKVTTIGQTTLQRAVNRRIQALGLPDEESYTQKIKHSILELNELIEEVVVPETWFFRDKEPFNVLKKLINDVWSKPNSKGFLRLLSAPCSTGEEPYSLAIALLQACWPENKFQVVALDISTRSLARAKAAEYTRHSFRGTDDTFRNTFFQESGKKYILNKNIRRKVQFQHGNLLNPAFMSGLGLFDVIFCKNVLIYLDEESRNRAIIALERQLSEDGVLFVGHAETGLFTGSKFTPLPYPQSFAFQKIVKPKPLPSLFTAKSPFSRKITPDPPAEQFFHEKADSNKEEISLDVARQLADEGHIREAIKLCEINLQEHGPSAQAYFLMGVSHDAAGEIDKAEKLLRKAIYLEPNHLDALIHLSLLTERSGDLAGAQSIKQRIKRLEGQKNPAPKGHE